MAPLNIQHLPSEDSNFEASDPWNRIVEHPWNTAYGTACLFHLALGDKLKDLHFQQEEMQSRLKNCFEVETVLPFPHSMKY